MASKKTKLPKEVCGSYREVEVLGQGAYGKVLLVAPIRSSEDTGEAHERVVAKIINLDDDSLFDTSIIREIDSLRKFNHPNLLHSLVKKNGEKEQTYFSVKSVCQFLPYMDSDLYNYVKGLTGSDRLDQLSYLHSVFAQIVCGVQYLHKNHMIHRDLKLENVLIDSEGNARVSDFGTLINLGKSKETPFVFSATTLPWASPELLLLTAAKKEKLAPAIKLPSSRYYYGQEIDIYSLGWIGMELLFNIKPPWFSGKSQLSYVVFLKSIGVALPPGFDVNVAKWKQLLPEESQYFAKGTDYNAQPLNVDSVNFAYFEKSSFKDFFKKENYEFLEVTNPTRAVMQKYQTLKAAITSRGKERPNAEFMMKVFAHPQVECEVVKELDYPRFSEKNLISFSENFTPEFRSKIIEKLSGILKKFVYYYGENHLDESLLEAIDMMDRIFAGIKPLSEVDVNSFTCLIVYLVLSVKTDYPGSVEQIFLSSELFVKRPDWNRVRDMFIAILKKIGESVYRPTLDIYSDLSTSDALTIFLEELSPQNIVPEEWVF